MTQWQPPSSRPPAPPLPTMTPPAAPSSVPPWALPPATVAAPPASWTPPIAPAVSGYASAEGLARALRWMFAGWVILAGVSTALSFETYRALSGSLLDADKFARLTALDDRRALVALVEIVAYIVTAGVFIAWTRRVYRNLPALGATDLRHKPGWAVGGWFVPFVNLVLPKRIINDSWRGSGADDDTYWHSRPVARIIDFWWITLLFGGVVLNVSVQVRDGDGVAVVAWPFLAEAFSGALTAGAAILAFWVVTRLTERQEQAYVARTNTPPVPGDWTTSMPSMPVTRFAREDTARWLLPVAGIVALAAGMFAFSTTDGAGEDQFGPVTSGSVWVGALSPGDCFDIPDAAVSGAAEVQQVDLAPCDSAHDAEMFAVRVDPTPAGAAFPGDLALETSSFDYCLGEFTTYVGLAYDDSSLDVYAFWPTEASWNLGDRGVSCHAVDYDGEPLIGSVRGRAV